MTYCERGAPRLSRRTIHPSMHRADSVAVLVFLSVSDTRALVAQSVRLQLGLAPPRGAWTLLDRCASRTSSTSRLPISGHPGVVHLATRSDRCLPLFLDRLQKERGLSFPPACVDAIFPLAFDRSSTFRLRRHPGDRLPGRIGAPPGPRRGLPEQKIFDFSIYVLARRSGAKLLLSIRVGTNGDPRILVGCSASGVVFYGALRRTARHLVPAKHQLAA